MESRHCFMCKINTPFAFFLYAVFISLCASLLDNVLFRNDYVHFPFGWEVI